MKKKSFLKHLIILLIFFFITLPFSVSQSHPHMSITTSIKFLWNGQKLKGALFTWTFDAYFSAEIIRTWDFNEDGKFDKEETNNVYNKAFLNLENYHYFIFIRIGDKRINPKKTSNFSVTQKNRYMTYQFFIDLSHLKSSDFYISVYDYTYFCDVRYTKKNPVTFSYNPYKVKAYYKIQENEKYPVYYNPLGAIDDTRVYYKWKPGLNTYYPREIHIRYVKK